MELAVSKLDAVSTVQAMMRRFYTN